MVRRPIPQENKIIKRKKSKSNRVKWKNTIITNENVDEYVDDLIEGTAGNSIIKGVAFNKDNERQINLLKKSLVYHESFSGLVKKLLNEHFEQIEKNDKSQPLKEDIQANKSRINKPLSRKGKGIQQKTQEGKKENKIVDKQKVSSPNFSKPSGNKGNLSSFLKK